MRPGGQRGGLPRARTGAGVRRLRLNLRFNAGDERPRAARGRGDRREPRRARRAGLGADPLRHHRARRRATRRGTRRRCRRYLAERLARPARRRPLGAARPTTSRAPLVPVGLDFDGRPQLARPLRRAPAAGAACCSTGTSTSSPPSRGERWTSRPSRAGVRDGMLYGRGSCDMKGGVASHGDGGRDARRPGRPPGGRPDRQHRSPTRSRPAPAASPSSRTACAPTPAS